MSAAITHSLGVIHPILPSPHPRPEPPDHADPHNLAGPRIAPQRAAARASAGVENNTNDLSLSERPAGQRPITPGGGPVGYEENLGAGPAGYPGMVDDRVRFKQGQREEWEQELSMYKTTGGGDNMEDAHPHRHAGLCIGM